MAALINALDIQTNIKFGENGHTEYGWTQTSNEVMIDLKEMIVQFNFQLVRNTDLTIMAKKFKNILQVLSCNIKRNETATKALFIEATEYLTIVCKLVAKTRDIIDGKG